MSTSAATTPVILSAKRTPIGKFFGALATTPAPTLGSFAIKAALHAAFGSTEAAAAHIDEAIMGSVVQAGLGQNPARQAALKAGLPNTLSCQTINKVCGSGLQAAMLAAQAIRAGDAHCIVAGGMENMTNAPHLIQIRNGTKFGNADAKDSMAHDGLYCAFESCMMGDSADYIASKFAISREDQDAFAARSHQLAAEATAKGYYAAEIAPITGEQLGNRKNPGPEGGLSADEGIRPDTNAATLAKLKPAFNPTGSVTAGNASQISDGAAALVIASAAKAEQLGIAPIARIRAYHTSGTAPRDIFTAPALAVPAVLDKAGLKASDIDLFELNEAFAVQALHNTRTANIPLERTNITGGAIALGHPIGASGARVLTTLLHQMIRTNAKRGLAALCLGGGNAVAMIVER